MQPAEEAIAHLCAKVAGLLGGMAAGFVMLWGRAAWTVFQRRSREMKDARPKKKRRKGAGHLKLVINRERPRKDDEDDADDSPGPTSAQRSAHPTQSAAAVWEADCAAQQRRGWMRIVD